MNAQPTIDDNHERKRRVIELLQHKAQTDHYTAARIHAFNSQLLSVVGDIRRLSDIVSEYRHVIEIVTGPESLRIVSLELQSRINAEYETVLEGLRRFERLYPLRDKP